MTTVPVVQEVHLKTARDLVEYLRLYEKRWELPLGTPRWLFRGHASSDWTLTARGWREFSSLRGYLRPTLDEKSVEFDEWLKTAIDPGYFKGNELRCAEIVRQVTSAHDRATLRFIAIADDLGLQVGTTDSAAGRAGGRQRLTRSSLAMALAQHHGVPTPLLDWSTVPHIAVHFAIRAAPVADSFAIWALDARTVSAWEGWGADHLPVRRFKCPRASHSYLHAQSGQFLEVGEYIIINTMMSKGHIPTVDEVLYMHEDQQTSPLMKITVPSTEMPELRRMLAAEQISDVHLMPSFDNVAKAVNAQYLA